MNKKQADMPSDSAGTPAASDRGALPEHVPQHMEKVRLPSSVTVADLAEVHTELLDQLQKTTRLEIDASDVEVVDGAGMQLLVAAFKSASSRCVYTVLRDPSEVMRRAVTQLGLAQILLTEVVPE